MIAISDEFDSLVTRTNELLLRVRTDALFLDSSLESIIEMVDDAKDEIEDKEHYDLLVETIQDVQSRLNNGEIDEWRDAILLEAEWMYRKDLFTADFESYFGSEAVKESQGVASCVLDWLSDTFAIIGSTDSSWICTEKVDKLSASMRSAIEDLIKDYTSVR